MGKNASVWGNGDPATLELLHQENISGNWLNLAAGDGRYNLILISKAKSVVASDSSQKALDTLLLNTSKKFKKKLTLSRFDLTQKFPFDDGVFDGVFCTGTLHLFAVKDLKLIFSEITRILKPNGKLIFDFATNVKRVLFNGKLFLYPKEPQYTFRQAKQLLQKLLPHFNLAISPSTVPPETLPELGYIFSCKFLLVVGVKK